MNKFCVKCGSPINPKTGVCPKCHNPIIDIERQKVEKNLKSKEEKELKKEQKKQAWKVAKQRYKSDLSAKKKVLKKAKKEKKAAKRAAMPTKQKIARIFIKFLILLIVLALLSIGVCLGLKNLRLIKDPFSGNKTNTQTTTPGNQHEGGSIDINNPPTGDMPDEYKIEKPDADEYFSNNSTIISEESASGLGSTEAETYTNLTGRGFTQEPITTEYNMDGTFFDEKEISESGQDKHPMYITYYETEDGRLWTIFEVNGEVFANPVFYNLENNSGVQLLISESDTLTSYDGTLNKFYVTKPNDDVATVKTIERIDAATLETLTEGEINNL